MQNLTDCIYQALKSICVMQKIMSLSLLVIFNIIVNDYIILAPMGLLVLPKHNGTNIMSAKVAHKNGTKNLILWQDINHGV